MRTEPKIPLQRLLQKSVKSLLRLDPKPDVTLDEVIAEAEAILNAEGAEEKYTADSYDALADIVAEAKAE